MTIRETSRGWRVWRRGWQAAGGGVMAAGMALWVAPSWATAGADAGRAAAPITGQPPPGEAGVVAPPTVLDFTPAQAYQLALEAQTAQEYPEMLAWLRRAAAAGELPAQELLVSVLLSGPAVSGAMIVADLCEARRWQQQAAVQGSVVAEHQALLLNGRRDQPGGRDYCAAASSAS